MFKQDNKIKKSESTKVLTKKETEKYFREYMNGNIKARDELIQHNIGFVIYIARKKFGNIEGCYEDDIISIGTIGLIKAVDTYNPDKGIDFASYASRCIENEILMSFRYNKKHLGNVSLNDVTHVGKWGYEYKLEDTIEDVTHDLVSNYEDKDIYSRIIKIINDFPEREKEIITLCFGLFGNRVYTQTEITEKWGITQSCISRILKKCLEQIKQELEKDSSYMNTELLTGVLKYASNKLIINCDSRDIYNNIINIIKKLPEEEKKLVSLYYGICGESKHKRGDIANILNKKPGSISEQIKKVLKKIASNLNVIIENENNKNEEDINNYTQISIYEIYNEYESRLVDEAIAMLDDYSKLVYKLRCDNNDNSYKFNSKLTIYFYNTVIKLIGQNLEKLTTGSKQLNKTK